MWLVSRSLYVYCVYVVAHVAIRFIFIYKGIPDITDPAVDKGIDTYMDNHFRHVVNINETLLKLELRLEEKLL